MGERNYTFDANMSLSDGLAALTAAGYAQSAGADGIIDLGGNQGVTITLPSIADSSTITPQQARIDAVLVMWLTAITVSGSDIYKVLIVGSNDPSFGTTAGVGNVVLLGQMTFGESAQMDIVNGANTPAPATIGGSMYEIPFTTEQNGVKYEYVKLYVAGTFGSITLKAFVAVLPRE